jgi:serine/threonine protein kinase
MLKQKKTMLGPPLASSNAPQFAPQERKIHRRALLETLKLYVLLKPQYLVRVTLFAVVVCCSLSLAFRLHSTAVVGNAPDSSASRVLFQPPPAEIRLPKANARSIQESWNTAPPRPRVVGVYWPDNYDTAVHHGVGPSIRHSHRNADSVQLLVENLDASMIRPLTDRTIDMSKTELDGQLHLENSKDYEYGAKDVFEEGQCKAQYDWQLLSNPTCNVMHEHPLWDMFAPKGDNKVKFLTNGYWRDVWMVRDNTGQKMELGEPLALKTIRYEHSYEERNYDRHRRDAVAMEHLTSSPNVIAIYGFCGNSGIFEYATGGSLEDAIWFSDEPEWNSTEKLIVAYQVANGLADLHNSDVEGQPSIAHTDITPSQFVFVNKYGRFLLNDFNRCRFIRWNQKTNEACPFHVGSNPGTVRQSGS